MDRFEKGSQTAKEEEDYDQYDYEDHYARPVSKSFISFNIPTNEKSTISSASYQKDPKRVINRILNMSIWRHVLNKTEEMNKAKDQFESIQNVMNSLIKWQVQTRRSLSSYFESHYKGNNFEENLQERLAKEVQALILRYIKGKGTQDTTKQDCENFAISLNFNSLFLSECCSCIKANAKLLKTIKEQISENEIYKILNRYGKNIYYLEYQFIQYFFIQFFNKLSFKVFYDILQQLIRDPFYCWINRKDLNYEQNTILIEKLWLNDQNPLFELMQTEKYSQTTTRLIELDKRNIQDFLLHIAKFPLSCQELTQIRTVLDSGDLQEFFDNTRYIKDELKKVYPYIAQNCKHFLNLKNEPACLFQLQQQNLLRLRAKLFQMLRNEQFNISDWTLIETSIMSNTLNKAQRAFKKGQASYFSLKQWVFANLADYFSKAFEPKRQKELVSNQLKLCFINSKVQLKYMQVVTIVDQLLETPYADVIQASGLLKPNDINLLKDLIQKLQLFKKYSAKLKQDPDYIFKKAQREIYKVLDSPDLKLTSEKKEQLYQRFLKKPCASSIYETPNICYLYRQTIFRRLSQIKEINDYIENHKIVQRTQKLSMLKSQLQKIITNKSDYELVLDYISINGEIKFQNDQDITVKLQQSFSDLKRILMLKLKAQHRKSLRQLQQKQYFIELKQQLPQIHKIYINQCKAKFKCTVRNTISKSYQLGEDEKQQLVKIIIDIIDYQDIKAFDENQQLKDINFQPLVFQIKGSKLFKLLSNSTNAIKANYSKYAQIILKNKIRSIYDHQNLVQFSADQKMAIINSLIQKIDFEQIKTFDFLNVVQQRFIVNFITQSEEYKQFQTYKDKRPINVSNIAPLPTVQKAVEKKKIQPPRAAEKKEEAQSVLRSNLNPERESNNESKKQASPAQQFYDPISEPIRIVSNIKSQQQPAATKSQIITKWAQIFANINDKNLFKRERQLQGNQLQFTQKLMMAYPWTAQNTTFFAAPKEIVRRKIIGELDTIIAQRGEFADDARIVQSA